MASGASTALREQREKRAAAKGGKPRAAAKPAAKNPVAAKRPAAKAAPARGTGLTVKQAAAQVLADGNPMKLSEISKRVLETPGLTLNTKTPFATIAKTLSVEHAKKDGLVIRTAPGTYQLRAPAQS